MKMKMKMKNRLHRYNLNRPRSRRKKCLTIMMLIYVLSNTYATLEAQFMKDLSSTEAELEKSFAYKKNVYNFQ